MNKQLNNLHEQANNAAVAGNFQAAIGLNEEIIAQTPEDVDAYLRLGFAHLQCNDLENSKKAYKQALKLEPINQIARNNLDKIKVLEKAGGGEDEDHDDQDLSLNPNLFLNVLGKTKEISLVNIGQADVLAKLKIGQYVELKVKKRRVEVRDRNNEYVGALPDDISKRLIFFLEADSTFLVYIKAASKNTVDIFLKEEKRGTKVRGYISFPKNIQDDLKDMSMDGDAEEREQQNSADSAEEDDSEMHESEVDLEALADKDDDEYMHVGHSDFDDEEE